MNTIFAILVLFTASAFANTEDAIGRTYWQYWRHEPAHFYPNPAKDGFYYGPPAFADLSISMIPDGSDSNWKSCNSESAFCTNPESLGVNLKSRLSTCRSLIDLAYFQTFLTVPVNVEVTQFSLTFSKMDDVSRVTIFNSQYPLGQIVDGSYVVIGSAASTNVVLKDFLVKGVNRVVITQLDVCANWNSISALVSLNGNIIPASCPSTQCRTGTPTSDGQCTYSNVADGTGCDDQNLCTSNDKCSGGLCVGTPKVCDGICGQTNQPVCDLTTGKCPPAPRRKCYCPEVKY